MPYLYKTYDDPKGPFTVINLFPGGRWRAFALQRLFTRQCLLFMKFLHPSWYLSWLFYKWLIKHRTMRGGRQLPNINPLTVTRRACLRSGEHWYLCSMWWLTYFLVYDTVQFEEDYLKAWQDRLERQGPVVWVHIFTGNDSLRIPLSFDSNNPKQGCDRDTFESLRMWYSWLKVKRGFSEILLPKRLIRIDKVGLCNAIEGVPGLGVRKRALELGRNASSHVANFENPSNIPESQRFQTEDIAKSADIEGIEFVRSWDAVAVSMISLVPFAISLVFAGIWIGISVHNYGVDAQMATQTAFTVAAYIVTAGALLIALFAFLDSQAQHIQ